MPRTWKISRLHLESSSGKEPSYALKKAKPMALVLEDNGQPLVVDQRWPDTEYAMVDDEGYLIVDDADNVVVGIDYLTTNESFETN